MVGALHLKANGCEEYTLQSSSNGWNTVDFVVPKKNLINVIISDIDRVSRSERRTNSQYEDG